MTNTDRINQDIETIKSAINKEGLNNQFTRYLHELLAKIEKRKEEIING